MDEMKKCPYCGEEIRQEAIKCRYCGSSVTPPPYNECNYRRSDNNPFNECPEGKSRGVTAILAILLGGLGIHYFYLGKTTGGIVFLTVSLVSCGTISSLLGLIQGVIMFGITNDEFRRRYVLTDSSFPF